MSVLGDITSGWNKKTPSNTDTEGNPPQAGSVAKQIVSEYDASAGNVDNNPTVKGIVPTSNPDGTVNTVENKPVYNVKEDAASKYNLVNQLNNQPNNSQPVVSPQPAEPATQPSYTSLVDNFIKNYTPESDKQKEQREKRERRNKIFTSVADGIGALANIVGGVNGSKNANPQGISMTKAYQDRLDHLRQLRKENEQRYIYYLQKKEEDRRRDEAKDWDRTKFAYEQNFKIGESKRDQANKDREYDRNVDKDKTGTHFKNLDAQYKKDSLVETKRSHRASEGISQNNATTNQQRANIESSKENVDRTWAEVYNKHPQEAKDFERKYNIGDNNGSMSGFMHAPTAWTQEQKKTFIAQMRSNNNSTSHSGSKSKVNIEQFKVNHGKKTKNPPLN